MINFGTFLPHTPRSSKRNIFLRCSHQTPVHTSLVSHTCYMPRLSHSAWYNHQNNIWWAVGPQIIKFLRMWPFLVLLRPKYPPQQPVFQHPQPVQVHLTLVMSPSPWHCKLMSHDFRHFLRWTLEAVSRDLADCPCISYGCWTISGAISPNMTWLPLVTSWLRTVIVLLSPLTRLNRNVWNMVVTQAKAQLFVY